MKNGKITSISRPQRKNKQQKNNIKVINYKINFVFSKYSQNYIH